MMRCFECHHIFVKSTSLIGRSRFLPPLFLAPFLFVFIFEAIQYLWNIKNIVTYVVCQPGFSKIIKISSNNWMQFADIVKLKHRQLYFLRVKDWKDADKVIDIQHGTVDSSIVRFLLPIGGAALLRFPWRLPFHIKNKIHDRNHQP